MNLDWATISKLHVGMGAVLAMAVIFLLLLLWIWHRESNNRVDLKDLVCKEGRLDEKKFTRFGAWIVSTWGFVYMIMDGKFTEWYFFGYMSVWTTNAILDKYLTNKNTESRGATQ